MKPTAKPDYDQIYQEDLEKAQALSLETLALEEFKNRKLQSESSSSNEKTVLSTISTSTSTSQTRSMSFTGLYFKLK